MSIQKTNISVEQFASAAKGSFLIDKQGRLWEFEDGPKEIEHNGLTYQCKRYLIPPGDRFSEKFYFSKMFGGPHILDEEFGIQTELCGNIGIRA